ncbi:MAG: biotin--[acetyl-CoA-carboxylase] ligase [Candidatus Nanopelagicaceae bacterium]|nr:biotin--[acetyl-CoA-carboxylase] ligase [Candidatus Nanopelagicaceae bacterium]
MEVEMVREALNESAINATLHDSYWRVSVFESVTSTQTELSTKENLKNGDVFVAEYQSAGRGRLDRTFDAEKSSALLFSLYFEPKRSKSEWSAIPLLTGLSLVNGLTKLDEKLAAKLKWPNDLLVGEKKVAGILVEAKESGVIIGIGLNVEMSKDELPVENATSLAIEGFSEFDRNKILPALLKSIAFTFGLWESGSSLPFEQYRQASSTLGKEVEVHLPSGQILKSLAVGISEIGELQLADGNRVNVGDVIHLR